MSAVSSLAVSAFVSTLGFVISKKFVVWSTKELLLLSTGVGVGLGGRGGWGHRDELEGRSGAALGALHAAGLSGLVDCFQEVARCDRRPVVIDSNNIATKCVN